MDDSTRARIQPRLVIHGGAGNITRATLAPDRRRAYRAALLDIVTRTHAYMTTPADGGRCPTSLDTATFAVALFEDCALFNSGRGAVFTRDGINELEASVMVSGGKAKRGVGVMGLRRVRNPVLLARHMLEHGDADLAPKPRGVGAGAGGDDDDVNIDAGAQGHTQIYGAAAEALAARYGLPLVDPAYFFTQARWDEHVRGLEGAACSWSPDEYLPQGTCGAVALDADGVVCCATSTGGLTNKLTGRIGDTPVVGAGFWAGAWIDACTEGAGAPTARTTARAIGLSGTGNGDSFLRVSAAHTVAAMAQYTPASAAAALAAVAGPGGILQASAGDRWGRTGEGEGGMIGVESVVVQDSRTGAVRAQGTVVQDYNCGGMFRAWIDDEGDAQVRIFRDDADGDA